MVAVVSEILVLVAGVSLCVFAAWGIYAPLKLLQSVKGVMDEDWGIYVAVLVRLALGFALILSAPESRFPSVFLVLGWVAIAAGVAAAFLGRERLRKFVNWWVERFSPATIRLWVLFAMAFGGFLIYGVS
jgi:hypothetical protein